MSVLNEICDKKRAHVEQRKAAIPFEEIKAKITRQSAPRGFVERIKTLARTDVALITEVKKASPSKGVIREDFNPVEIAESYESAGAACISVLTDEPYFQGKDEYFKNIRTAVSLPLLRKDFMVDEYQIYESRALGADCILLIMAALDDSQASHLHKLSEDLGMDVLFEVHNEEELERVLVMNPKMVGVNNRNLKTLDVDVQTSFDLVGIMPPGIVKIAESGLADHATLKQLQDAGFSGFLVGESLMKQDNIGLATKKLMGK